MELQRVAGAILLFLTFNTAIIKAQPSPIELAIGINTDLSIRV